jgi:transmembrane sensor
MTSVSIKKREVTEKEAALWTARLETGTLTATEQRELSDWLEINPDHVWLLSRYRELCAQLRTQLPMLTDEAELDEFIEDVAVRNRHRRWGWRSLLGAVSLGLARLIWSTFPGNVTTDRAERRTLTLDDGTRVELNAQSTISVDFSRAVRRVKLERGEAFFTVSHNSSRPFIVETSVGNVRVTGTVFNVRATALDTTEVTVIAGSVQIQPENRKARDSNPLPVALKPSDLAIFGSNGVKLRELSIESAQDMVAWRLGQVAFESEPLSSALGRFEAYHKRLIKVAPEVGELRVGGRYSLDDLDGFLTAIEQAIPVVVIRAADSSVHVVARSKFNN